MKFMQAETPEETIRGTLRDRRLRWNDYGSVGRRMEDAEEALDALMLQLNSARAAQGDGEGTREALQRALADIAAYRKVLTKVVALEVGFHAEARDILETRGP